MYVYTVCILPVSLCIHTYFVQLAYSYIYIKIKIDGQLSAINFKCVLGMICCMICVFLNYQFIDVFGCFSDVKHNVQENIWGLGFAPTNITII